MPSAKKKKETWSHFPKSTLRRPPLLVTWPFPILPISSVRYVAPGFLSCKT